MQTLDIVVVVIGIALFGWAFVAFRNPALMLRGRKARMWVRLIGEEKTIAFGRFVGVPLTVLIGVLLVYMGTTGKASEMQERQAARRAAAQP